MRFITGALFLSLALLTLSAVPAHADRKVRITSVATVDSGNPSDVTGSPSLDVVQGQCGTDCDDPNSSCTEEPFHDTIVKFKVINTSGLDVRFNNFSFTVRNPYGSGGTAGTKGHALVGSGEVPAESTETILSALFLDVQSGTKAYAGHFTAIPTNLGFRNVIFRLSGRDSSGRAVRVTVRTAISLDDKDNC